MEIQYTSKTKLISLATDEEKARVSESVFTGIAYDFDTLAHVIKISGTIIKIFLN